MRKEVADSEAAAAQLQAAEEAAEAAAAQIREQLEAAQAQAEEAAQLADAVAAYRMHMQEVRARHGLAVACTAAAVQCLLESAAWRFMLQLMLLHLLRLTALQAVGLEARLA